MDLPEKPKKPASPPAQRRNDYPSPYGTGQPGSYPSAPGGRRNDGAKTEVNGGYGPSGDGSAQRPYRPYDSMPSLPLQQKPSSPPPQSLPPNQQQQQQQQQPYPPYIPSAPASMVEIPPQPTMSTSGSVVGGAPGGGVGGGRSDSGYGGGPGRPPLGPGPPVLTQSPGPMYATDTMTKADIRSARASVEEGLGRIMDLQRQQLQHLQYGPGAANVRNSTAAAVQEQLRLQTGSVLRDLRYVRRAIYGIAKAAENHRFRRWLVGGVLATFIPLVRRLFRRFGSGSNSSLNKNTANDTEYAFVRSRSLVDRMLNSVTRRGGLASIAFFVFAVLYIFSNEVSLRVARTVGRRLKRLSTKLERGDEPLDEADLKQLSGWRWRVLLWGRQ
ncbi:hypothetical protein SCUCBS95973_000941 [Sporothrix curviconia]|uniref:Peroxin-13 n=1 Tax=Sporothrix curviconia TaxID=1260050 RepID=A0ABP0AUF7_9PEZI